MTKTVARPRLRLNRLLPALVLVILLIFWWALAYNLLVAGWWLFKGYSFEDEASNPYVWNGVADWVFMILALISVWPVQRWLGPRIALLAEDGSDNPYAVISRVLTDMDTELTAETLPPAIVRSLAETLNL